MKTKIYQISKDRDVNRVRFLGWEEIEEISNLSFDSSIYNKVFDEDIPEIDLEEIYCRFNTIGHPEFKGHSLSVSDIVENDNGTFFCDNIGWKKIENVFD